MDTYKIYRQLQEKEKQYKDYDNYDKKDLIDIIEKNENEKQQLISWLEDKIKKCDELIEKLKKYGNDYDLPLYESQAFQEVLDFVNKGGKE